MRSLARRVPGLPLLAVLGIVLVALVLGALTLHEPVGLGSGPETHLFIQITAGAGIVYLAAVAVVLRREMPPRTVWLVLAVAAAMRAPLLPVEPFLSSDLYRYIWDGRVQEYGINPYRYIPADPALEFLRDADIYPLINRATYAPTIYPPMAQIIFRAVAAISETPFAEKAVMVAFELLAIFCLVRLLALARLPTSRVLIYAWNPVAVWAFAGNGHVDAAVVGLTALALLARAGRRFGWAGALLGAAVLVKFLPAALAPALWRRWDWRFPAACGVIIVALYLCYIDVGWAVLGFLPGYGAEEGISQGTGFWLLAGLARLGVQPAGAVPIYLATVALLLLGAAAWVALRTNWPKRQSDDVVAVCRASGLLAAATMAALNPHYPWYFVWLAVPACVAPYRCVVWLSVAPLILDLDPLGEKFLWPSLIYVPALVLAALDYRQARQGAGFGLPAALGENT